MRRCLPKHMIQASRRVPWVVKEGCVKANCRDSTKGRKDSMLVHMGEPPCPCELQSLQGYEDPPFLSPSCYILWTLVHLNLRKFSQDKDFKCNLHYTKKPPLASAKTAANAKPQNATAPFATNSAHAINPSSAVSTKPNSRTAPSPPFAAVATSTTSLTIASMAPLSAASPCSTNSPTTSVWSPPSTNACICSSCTCLISIPITSSTWLSFLCTTALACRISSYAATTLPFSTHSAPNAFPLPAPLAIIAVVSPLTMSTSCKISLMTSA